MLISALNAENLAIKKCTDQWHVDATYLKIESRWCYLYRAIDKQGDLIDVYLSDTRDLKAAKEFLKQRARTLGVYPEKSQLTKHKFTRVQSRKCLVIIRIIEITNL